MPKSNEGIFLGYCANIVAYSVLFWRRIVIEGRYDVKFYDFYVWKTTLVNKKNFIMDNYIPI